MDASDGIFELLLLTREGGPSISKGRRPLGLLVVVLDAIVFVEVRKVPVGSAERDTNRAFVGSKVVS